MDRELTAEEMSTAQLIAGLRDLLRSAPKGHSTWPISRSVEYKAAAGKAQKLLDTRSMRRDFLTREYKALKVFY